MTRWLYSSNISQYVWVNHKIQEKDTQLIIGFNSLYMGIGDGINSALGFHISSNYLYPKSHSVFRPLIDPLKFKPCPIRYLIVSVRWVKLGTVSWNWVSVQKFWKLLLRRRLCAISRGSGCWWGHVARPFLRSHVRSWDLKFLCLLRLRFSYGFCLPAPWNPLAEREAGR